MSKSFGQDGSCCIKPVDTQRKLNVNKTFNLRPVSAGKNNNFFLADYSLRKQVRFHNSIEI